MTVISSKARRQEDEFAISRFVLPKAGAPSFPALFNSIEAQKEILRLRSYGIR